ncbi:conserved hypothetical protein [Ricinus communis]|uniref:Uncharacterized protein n=1 Tax=Ricinus communis TaxID=3988 RepID=B9SAC4_RICCO|nr:conserved hypothetical protein [Ricinus communis]
MDRRNMRELTMLQWLGKIEGSTDYDLLQANGEAEGSVVQAQQKCPHPPQNIMKMNIDAGKKGRL